MPPRLLPTPCFVSLSSPTRANGACSFDSKPRSLQAANPFGGHVEQRRSTPAGAYLPATGELVVSDGTRNGLTLLDLDLLQVSRQYN